MAGALIPPSFLHQKRALLSFLAPLSRKMNHFGALPAFMKNDLDRYAGQLVKNLTKKHYQNMALK